VLPVYQASLGLSIIGFVMGFKGVPILPYRATDERLTTNFLKNMPFLRWHGSHFTETGKPCQPLFTVLRFALVSPCGFAMLPVSLPLWVR